ncbi:hypothetical protein B7486_73030, partial [cyanobacterium TDX16]
WLALVAAATGEVQAVPERLLAYRVHAAQVTGIRRRPGRTHLPGLVAEEVVRPVQEVGAAAAATSSQLAALQARLVGGSPAWEEVARARAFLDARSALGAARSTRVRPVLGAVASGDYDRYGTGLVSGAADLVRPGRVRPSTPSDALAPILFLNHAANETGPPVLLLAFQRWLLEHAQRPWSTVHGAGGTLLPQFEELGPNVVLHH